MRTRSNDIMHLVTEMHFIYIKKILRKYKIKSSIRRRSLKHLKSRRKAGTASFNKYKVDAKRMIEERIRFLNNGYGVGENEQNISAEHLYGVIGKPHFFVRKVFIKNQKTRWGSCSKTGNLNFNYRLIHLSSDLVDYIIIHELCHLIEFNHSIRFWNLVGVHCPNYKKLVAELRKIKFVNLV